MPLYNVPLGIIELYLLVLLRVGGLLMTMPVFGASEIFRSVKVGLAAVFALVLTSTMVHKPLTVPAFGGEFILAAGGELLLGLMGGYLISWVLEAVLIGGQMIGFQMGFAVVNVVDPMTGNTVSIIATLEAQLATVVFLVSGLYRPFLEAIATSYDLVPLAQLGWHASQGAAFINVLGQAFKVAVTLAGAPIAALMITNVILGIMARTVPQMNVFMVGFPLTIGVGFLSIAVTLSAFVRVAQHSYADSLRQMLMFFKSVGP